MKKSLLIISALVLPILVTSQPCLPEGITFTSQAQIDSFQIIYPGCTEIEGSVKINGSDITNLYGLSVLTSIEGMLSIGVSWGYVNSSLTSLSGLDSLTYIGGNLFITGNFALTSLTGLENVNSIGKGLFIGYDMPSFSAGNPNLTSLTGLEGLTSIGEEFPLWIFDNDALTSLTGIDNIDEASIDNLTIFENASLSSCEVQSVCDYLSAPGGTIKIHDNATGCNSPEEVQDSCIANGISIDENYIIEGCMLSPNPFTTSTTLSYTLSKPSNVVIRIFNSKGQQVEKIEQEQPKGEQQVQWNAEGLPAGMYYFRIQAGDKVGGGKMVKMK